MAKSSTLTPRSFIESAAGPSFGGAYLVYGHDEYIKSETVRRAVERFMPREQAGFGIHHQLGNQTDTASILHSVQAIPMLGERVAVVIHDAHKLASAHKARLPDRLDDVAGPSLLIFVGPPEIDRRTRFYKWFTDAGRAVACEPLTASKAAAFAQRKLKAAGRKAAPGAMARLLDLTGNDAGALASEIEKLALFVGERDTVEVPDIDTVAGHTAGAHVADLVPPLLAGDRPRALSLVRRLVAAGIDPAGLLGRLAMHFFDLRRAQRAGTRQHWELARTLRLPGARAEQLVEWLRGVREERLKHATEHVADAEALVRSGRADPRAVVDSLTLALSGTTGVSDKRSN